MITVGRASTRRRLRDPDRRPESDGTLEWDSTTVVVVEARAGGETGIGYTLRRRRRRRTLVRRRARVESSRAATPCASATHGWPMGRGVRNAGRPGIGFDGGLGRRHRAVGPEGAAARRRRCRPARSGAHEAVPIYGSGGFCTYSLTGSESSSAAGSTQGIPRVKMKRRRATRTRTRRGSTRCARRSATRPTCMSTPTARCARKQALAWAERFRGEWGVSWFEEPVTSDDLEGLRLLRDRGPAGLDVAAGEYGYVLADFRNLLDAGAVDCLQADVTRCGGITGCCTSAGCATPARSTSRRTARRAVGPRLHRACGHLRHLEYFHDHVRDRAHAVRRSRSTRVDGGLRPDRSAPGLGLELKQADAEHYAGSHDERVKIAPSRRGGPEFATRLGWREGDRHVVARTRRSRRRSRARCASTPRAARCTPPTRRTSGSRRSAS